ncbi:hypothetical protein SMIR_38150 [Streptomyces mirabilis]|nr:hypothetical protein HEP84_06980 [Streptomyces sp. RLB1-33]QUW85312.1 hypothetical protein SMIR_38150 [Streptomyces mirabilis]
MDRVRQRGARGCGHRRRTLPWRACGRVG